MENLKAQEFLTELFEFEYCPECYGDGCHHTVVVDPIGNLFARCNFPPSKATNWEMHPVIKQYRDTRKAQ